MCEFTRTAMRMLIFAGLVVTVAPVRGSVIMFNEIMYNPGNDAQELEFVEIYNTLSYDMDISLWKLAGGIEYTFPVGTTAPSEGCLVIAKSPAVLEAAAGISGVLGPFNKQLANGGESIRLENISGRIMDEIEYGDGGRWPVAPDGSGASLAKIDPFTASASAANWHSGGVGGTPGRSNFGVGEDADLLNVPLLVINEVAGVTDTPWWIELKNNSDSTLDCADYVVSVAGDPARTYTLPGSSLPEGGFLLLTAAQLGFTAVDEEPIFLYRPGGESVADARVAKNSLRGRYGNAWLHPSIPTPGSANVFALNDDIVINEIMYHHQPTNTGSSYAESDEEWIELYNRGPETVDLSGWKFDDGIRYEFTAGTMLASGEYLVVSDFSGSLANGGERLLLLDAAGNPADEVEYFDGGRWPQWADGRGSSLELRDPFADNNIPEAWAASDESLHSGWQEYSYQVTASASPVGPDSQWQDFVLGLLDASEVLLDDISIIEDPGGADTELISTRDFENGVGNWRIIGNHRHSEVIVEPDNPANHVLRLVATGATEHMHNHAEITLANGQSVENGKTYRITLRAKWIGGSRLLNTRLYFNRAAKTHVLQVPMDNGTPGKQNSAYAGNIGPTFEPMRHKPAVPDVAEPVRISVDVNDPDGVASVHLWYAVDGGSWRQRVMTSYGEDHYSATIPGQSASSIVQFYVEAEDGLGAVSMFPAAGPAARALYMVNDGLSDPRLHNFRIIMTQADADWMDNDRNYMSNDPIGATVIFMDRDIYYDVGVRLKGSLAGRHASLKVGYRVGFNAEKLFNGVLDNVSVDRSALPDLNRMPETLIHLAMNRCGGVMSKYSDMIKVIAPISRHTSPAQLQLGHYSDVFLDGQFENGGEGELFEFEYIYYPTNAFPDGHKNYGESGGHTGIGIQDLGSDKENYRHTFLIKNNRARDDYGGLINFATVMGMTGSAFNDQVDSVADVDQWLRYLAYGIVTGNTDNFSRGNDHNAMFYRRPSDGRFLYFTHDLDHKLSGPQLISDNEYLQKMVAAKPEWERLYYAHMHDILTTAWN
ncbi:MAG: lamin tail domain-containing protein, partial [Sedimentisphaerales bacterium]|nr:lamin tail domain-containing protein [Sedimentisphaerales bacterium]